MNTEIQEYRRFPDIATGLELNAEGGMIRIAVPCVAENLLPDPSFERTDVLTTVNAIASNLQTSDNVFSGNQSIAVSPTQAAAPPCDYFAMMFIETNSGFFTGVTINGVFYPASILITFPSLTWQTTITTFLNGLGLGTFSIVDFGIVGSSPPQYQFLIGTAANSNNVTSFSFNNSVLPSGIVSTTQQNCGAALPYGAWSSIAVSGGCTYTFGIHVCVCDGDPIDFELKMFDGSTAIAYKKQTVSCCWERIEFVFTVPENVSLVSWQLWSTNAVRRTWYFDGAMLLDGESLDRTYFDGDNDGRWTGARLISSSIQDGQCVYGGKLLDLAALGFQIKSISGGGLPAQDHISENYALRNGRSYQRTMIRARTFTFVGRLCACCGVSSLHEARQRLIDLFKPFNSRNKAAPILLRYKPRDCRNKCGEIEARVKFVDGLSMNIENPACEDIALTFVEDAPPSLTSVNSTSHNLAFSRTFNAAKIMTRGENNDWAEVGANGAFSASTVPFAFIRDNAGRLYMGGSLPITLKVLDVATNTWIAPPMGATTHTTVRAMLVKPNGDFITAGDGFAVSSGGVSPFTSIAPIAGGFITDLLLYPSGDVYACGAQTTPSKMFKWDGVTITNIVTSLTPLGGGTADIRAMQLLPDGRIIVGGRFSAINGVPAWCLAIYSPTTNTFSAIATTGVTVPAGPVIFDIGIGCDGMIYVCGVFDSINGVVCKNVMRWNGAGWLPMGRGVEGGVPQVISTNPQNCEVWFGGGFRVLNTNSPLLVQPPPAIQAYGGVGIWNGSQWAAPDIVASLFTAQTTALWFDNRGNVYTGYYDATSVPSNITTSAKTNVCYCGTADARPIITFTGAGRILNVRNDLTDDVIYLDYQMQANETVTLDLTGNTNALLHSSYYGAIPGRIQRASKIDTFALLAKRDGCTDCGECNNQDISILITNSNATTRAVMTYKNTHWSFDASVEGGCGGGCA